MRQTGTNATCESYFITKCKKSLLQNVSGFFIKKMRQLYYKMQRFYYNIRQLLQNAAFTTKCVGTTSSPAHLFAIRGRQKRGPGTRQTRD